MARLMVSKEPHELLGATEFKIRDQVHELGAFAIETAVNERKKVPTSNRFSLPNFFGNTTQKPQQKRMSSPEIS